MGRKLGYRWRLREIMAARGLYMTTDLAPLLEERGVSLSAPQVYRLVTQTPERLSLRTPMTDTVSFPDSSAFTPGAMPSARTMASAAAE